MKRLLFAVLFFLTVMTSQAQQITVYAAAGGIASQVEGDELKGFAHWGLHGGVGSNVHFGNNDRWSMTLETDYSCRGIYNHKFSPENFYNIDLNLHYVDIPLTFFFRDPYGSIYIGLGLAYSRLLSQPHGTLDYRPEIFFPDTNDMGFLKNDLAGALEIKFYIWRGLQFSTRFQYSLIPVKKDWHFQYGDQQWANNCYNSSLTFRLLWEFGHEDKPSHYNRNKKRRR